jgi:hypothetical protein
MQFHTTHIEPNETPHASDVALVCRVRPLSPGSYSRQNQTSFKGGIETSRAIWCISVQNGTDTDPRRVYPPAEVFTCNLNSRKKWPEPIESRGLSFYIARRREVSSMRKGSSVVASLGGI